MEPRQELSLHHSFIVVFLEPKLSHLDSDCLPDHDFALTFDFQQLTELAAASEVGLTKVCCIETGLQSVLILQ